MIGIMGQLGNRTTIDPADAPDWSTDKVNELIENIVEKSTEQHIQVAFAQRLITKEAKFLNKGRNATVPRTNGDSESSKASKGSRKGGIQHGSDTDDTASNTSGGTYYCSRLETDDEGIEYFTHNPQKAKEPGPSHSKTQSQRPKS